MDAALLRVGFNLSQRLSVQKCLRGCDVPCEAILTASEPRPREQSGEVVGVALRVVDEPLVRPGARLYSADADASEAS